MRIIQTYLAGHPQLVRLYRNAGIVFSGNVVASLLGLLVLAVLTRTLTIDQFGLYALITAYVSLLDRLTSFQTWQALIHFGAHAREQGQSGQLASLFAFGWLLDVGSGVLGFIMALVGALLVPHWFGLGEHAVALISIAASVLLVNWVSTPTALMRLYDQFYAQALYQKVSAGLTLIAVTVLWLSGANGILPYIIASTLGSMAGKFLFVGMTVREAKRQDIWRRDLIDLRAMLARTPRLWRFVLTTNADGIVRVLRDVDIFIVNAMLGTAAVGLYRVARVLTKAFGQVTGPFYQAIYPELSHLGAAGKFGDFARLMRQSALTLGIMVSIGWLVFMIFGKLLLAVAFGTEYVAAYNVTLGCLGAMVIWAFAQPLSPAMMALGKVGSSFIIHTLTTVTYVSLLFISVKFFGLSGAGLALFLFYLLWSASMYFVLKYHLNKQINPFLERLSCIEETE